MDAGAEITIAGGDAAVLVTGRKIGENGERQLARRAGRREAELRGHMHVAHTAVGEPSPIEPAVDVSGTIRTSIGDAVPGNFARNLPAVRQTKTYRRAETLQVVAHVFVTACRWQCEIARGGSE